MGDKYIIKNTQAGAIGKNVSANNTVFQNETSGQMQAELAKMLVRLVETKSDSEQIESIKEALKAAKSRKPERVRNILKGSGKWVAELAKSVSATVISKLISGA